MIINIRGTGGSGKTTLANRIMELYPTVRPVEGVVAGRTRVTGYLMGGETPDRPRLFVAGKYTTATGGCDTLPNLDVVYDLLATYSPPGNALYEGIMASEEVARAVALSKRQPLTVIVLTTPLEECLASIRARRAARGETKELNPKNTTDRYKRVIRAAERLRDAGVTVLRLSREEAFERCREMLGAGG